MKREEFYITGMTCAACKQNITKKVSKLDGVNEVSVNLLSSNMIVNFDETKIDTNKIAEAVSSIGYGASLKGQEQPCGNECKLSKKQTKSSDFVSEWNDIRSKQNDDIKRLKLRVIISFVFLIPLLYIAMGPMIGLPNFPIFVGQENALIFALAQLLLTSVVVVINKKFFISGINALLHKAPNMDTLVAVGAGASFIYGIAIIFILAYNFGHGNIDGVAHLTHSLYFESSATILTLVLLGKFFESRSKQKTSSALEKLMNLSPKTALVLRDGKEVEIETESILAGDIVIIKAGDTIPVDGEIVEGEGLLNQSAITGESIAVKKKVGETVISASICENGSFKFRAVKVGENTTLAEIIRLVSEAGSSKAKVERIADKVSGWFVPVVMAISLITFVVWSCINHEIGFALTSAVAVLVISCPCALGLATPVAIMVATGKSAQLGILTKSAESLEQLHKVDTVVFDKTGTVTIGKPVVTDIVLINENLSEEELLNNLAVLEKNSNHPLALAVVESAKSFDEAKKHKVENYTEVSGRGILANIDGKEYLAGNIEFALDRKLIKKSERATIENLVQPFQKQGKTLILFFIDKQPAGIVMIADKIKDDSKEAIAALQNMGLKVVMLTGDNKLTAEAIASELGITEVISNVLPSEKQEVIKKLQAEGKNTLMVGDGINDSPALALADVGMAVSSGTDIATQTADIVLTNGSLMSVKTAIELSNTTMRNIKMNLFWAFFYNALGIPLAAGVFYPLLGFGLSPMIASLAMSLSSVCVVLNALRLNFFKPKEKSAKINKNNKKLSKFEENLQKIEKGEQIMKKIIFIEGMMCGHCQMHVKNALESLDGVKKVEVSLEDKKAVVESNKNIENSAITKAIEDAGYRVTNIE